jgi:hypothetical protein
MILKDSFAMPFSCHAKPGLDVSKIDIDSIQFLLSLDGRGLG